MVFWKRLVIGLGIIVATVTLATACSSYDNARGKGDAPAAPGDDSSAAITNMPDGFSNLAVKCLKGDAPWAMGVTTQADFVIFQDPARCGGKAVLGPVAVPGVAQ